MRPASGPIFQGTREVYPAGKVLPGGRVPEILRQYPNLYADLSAGSALNALARDRAFSAAFLVEFQDKLLFGRDYFDTRLMDFLLELDLPAAVFEKIAWRNAQGLLENYLDEPGPQRE